MSNDFDLIVIGSGPGGYVAAIRAAQLGMKTAIVEKDPTFGGTCLNVGCIPSKALLESSEIFSLAQKGMKSHGVVATGVDFDLSAMMARKSKIVSQLTTGIAGLLKKNKITVLAGLGRFAAPDKIEVVAKDNSTNTYTTDKVLVATGSVPAGLPGIEWNAPRIGTSTDALSYTQVPKHLIVIGAGVIGLELGSVWARLGSKVTVLEFLPELLPSLDVQIRKLAQKLFVRQGLQFKFGVKVTAAELSDKADEVTVHYQNVETGGDQGASSKPESSTIVGDRLLVAVGRRPNTQGLQAEKVGLALDSRGFIVVDEHYKSNVSGIWAIGDVTPGPMLAHKAEEEGIAAVELMAGLPGHVNYQAIPNVIYTHPEIATVGKSEQEIKESNRDVRIGQFPFAANGRAKALGETEGMVKIFADAQTDRVLGAQVIGPRASELIGELAVAIEFSASSEDIARSVHAHPTLSEVIKEAALAVERRAIHI